MNLLSRVSRIFRSKPPMLFCAICSKPVAIERAKTDSNGQAVHDDCYFLQVKLKRIRDGYA